MKPSELSRHEGPVLEIDVTVRQQAGYMPNSFVIRTALALQPDMDPLELAAALRLQFLALEQSLTERRIAVPQPITGRR